MSFDINKDGESTSSLAKIFKASVTGGCVGILPHLLCAPIIAGTIAVSTGIGSGILPQFLPHELSKTIAFGLPLLSTSIWAALRFKTSEPIEKIIALSAGGFSLAFAIATHNVTPTHIESADRQNLIARWQATPADGQSFINDQIKAGMDCREAVNTFALVCFTPPIIEQNQSIANLPICLQESSIK